MRRHRLHATLAAAINDATTARKELTAALAELADAMREQSRSHNAKITTATEGGERESPA